MYTNFTVRGYNLSDSDKVRQLQLSANPRRDGSDLVEMEAMLASYQPGFVLIERDGIVIAAGVTSPEFESGTAYLWGMAVHPDYVLGLSYDLLKLLMAVIPDDEGDFYVTTHGWRKDMKFYAASEFQIDAPLAANSIITDEACVYGRDVTRSDIRKLRAELRSKGICVPTDFFLADDKPA